MHSPNIFLLGSTNHSSMPKWWDSIEDDKEWQKDSNYVLGSLYLVIGVIALVQLVRIQVRVPEYGWTTQKVFHLLNFMVAVLRAGVFIFREQMDHLDPAAVRLILFDLPGLLFFTTYTLLVLFWAEIYYQARSLPTGSLRPIFVVLNAIVYAIQGGLWAFTSMAQGNKDYDNLPTILAAVFMATVSVSAAAGFLLYGGRLFLMLRRFPIESRGRRKKLREVGLVTSICAACFSIRAIMVAASVIDADDLQLDVMSHPLLNFVYYLIAEIVPAAWVLYILRKLPPRRTPQQVQGYQPIPQNAA